MVSARIGLAQIDMGFAAMKSGRHRAQTSSSSRIEPAARRQNQRFALTNAKTGSFLPEGSTSVMQIRPLAASAVG